MALMYTFGIKNKVIKSEKGSERLNWPLKLPIDSDETKREYLYKNKHIGLMTERVCEYSGYLMNK